MLQDIAPHIFDNTYCNKRVAKEGDRILCFSKDEVYLKESSGSSSGYEFPEYGEIFAGKVGAAEVNGGDHLNEAAGLLRYLFAIDEVGYFLLTEDELRARVDVAVTGIDAVKGGSASNAPAGEVLAGNGAADCEGRTGKVVGSFQPIQVFRAMGEGDTVPLAMMTGFQIYTWMRKNRHCGCCGHETEHHAVERALFCPNCRNLIFPQISPAVAVAITDGDKILLARSAQGGFRRYALIAGYVEVGESVEETVRREVLEEVGLRVKNLKYFKSQPWGLTGIEMMGYFVELDGSNEVTIQESELAEARWFTAEEIDWEMPLHSLSYTMMDEFCKRQASAK